MTPPPVSTYHGPSSGKTTLITELTGLGYYTVPEAARTLIDEYAERGVNAKELRSDERFFQQEVLRMKLEIESKAPRDRISFYDRGVPDSIAYYQICGLDTQEVRRIARNRYRKVFFLEQLPFQHDYARTEDEATIGKLNQLLLESYEDSGYDIVYVSIASIEERLKLILSQI